MHKRFIKDSLKYKNFNHCFGGAVSYVRDCKIYSNTLLGPYKHNNKLKIGDIEKHTFLPSDLPLYQAQDAQKDDITINKKGILRRLS